jgi:hypothetical protein
MASAVVGAVVFFIFHNVWAGHHFIFLWVPLILLFADFIVAVPPPWRTRLVAAYLLLNAATFLVVLQKPHAVHASPDRDVIRAYFSDEAMAAKAIVNYSSWGGFYQHAIYGPKSQLVTYIEPLEKKESAKLFQIAGETGRTIYNACYGDLCNTSVLEKAFGGRLRFKEVSLGLAKWRLFKSSFPIPANSLPAGEGG